MSLKSAQIKKLEVGQMKTNCYIVKDIASGKCIIVDPGDEADYICRNIADTESTPVAIVATHGHFDHIMAAHELKLAYNIPFVCSPKDKFLLARLRKTAHYFFGVDTLPAPSIDQKPDREICFGELKFDVILTPGHTPGSISLYEKNENVVICGDLVFADGFIGRSDFGYANENKLKDSVAKIRRLPHNTLVLPGHGDAFLIN